MSTKYGGGYPLGLFDEEPTDEEGSGRWQEILDDMIYGFESTLLLDSDSVQAEGLVDVDRAKRGIELFGKHFKNLWF